MIRDLDANEYNTIIDLGNEYDSLFEKKYLSESAKVLAYEDQHPLGFLIIEQTIDENNIVLLYVSKDYRRKGIASKLLEHLINISQDKERLLLEVSENNMPAISLYTKYGFKLINKRKHYYTDGSDALIMEKRK